MDHIINLGRLGLLLSKHWYENRKAYGLFFLAAIASLTGWFFFYLTIGNPYLFSGGSQVAVYFAGLFIAGCLSANILFRDFSSRPRAINYQLLPAAAMEKLFCVLFYGVLVFFVSYTAIFYITDFFAVQLANNSMAAMMNGHSLRAAEWRQQYNMNGHFAAPATINVFGNSADMFIFYPGDNMDLFTAFFPIQSAFILGSVYFNRNGFFKTLVALLLIWLVFFTLEAKLLVPLLPDNAVTSRFLTLATVTDVYGNDKTVSLPFWTGDIMRLLLRYALTPAIWAATYFRLKEKEI